MGTWTSYFTFKQVSFYWNIATFSSQGGISSSLPASLRGRGRGGSGPAKKNQSAGNFATAFNTSHSKELWLAFCLLIRVWILGDLLVGYCSAVSGRSEHLKSPPQYVHFLYRDNCTQSCCKSLLFSSLLYTLKTVWLFSIKIH